MEANLAKIVDLLRLKVDHVHSLIQAQNIPAAKHAAVEAITECRLLQRQLQVMEDDLK